MVIRAMPKNSDTKIDQADAIIGWLTEAIVRVYSAGAKDKVKTFL